MPTEMSPSHPNPDAPRVALIGFGEAGSTFARAAGWEDGATAFDIDPARRAAMDECGVPAASGVQEALNGAEAVLSLVTAGQAVPAAQACAPHLAPGTLWLDMNSVAPDTKRRAAAAVEAAGGAYVDVAVMAPVDPARLNVPLLVAGPQAARAEAVLRALGFARVRVVGSEVGQASAIKLCRSIMVKGLEALTAEMVLAAGKADVLDEVLASLDASEKQVTWAERADYNLDRMLQHGRRRAAEMAEAAAMLRDLGIAPLMTENTVRRQDGLGSLGLRPVPDGLAGKLAAIEGKDATT
jgi:3-hydroxyisobutyrate dehydrogenase-like beta-hydroxyacid dehydrogenase